MYEILKTHAWRGTLAPTQVSWAARRIARLARKLDSLAAGRSGYFASVVMPNHITKVEAMFVW
jgi:hypothetical protein